MTIGKKNKLKFQIDFMIKKNYSFTFTDYIPIIQNNNFKKVLKPILLIRLLLTNL